MTAPSFSSIVGCARRTPFSEHAATIDGIGREIAELLDGPDARKAVQEARMAMEEAPALDGRPRLRRLPYGDRSAACDAEHNDVAAVDGTFGLPLQRYTAGWALGVGVGSVSHTRCLESEFYFWSDRRHPDAPTHVEEQMVSPTAVLRYFELMHALEIAEPIVLLDGPLLHGFLLRTAEGRDLYSRLWSGGKRVAGVIKRIADCPDLATCARALQTGEVYILPGIVSDGRSELAEIVRGVFKPANKTFGFETRRSDLELILRVLEADCQLGYPGHEIPFLLNRVDLEVRHAFNPQLLQRHIRSALASCGEEVVFEESDERSWC